MNIDKRLSALENARIKKTVDNNYFIENVLIEIVDMNEDHEVVVIGRHWHLKDNLELKQ